MTSTTSAVKCGECGKSLDEPPGTAVAQRAPCPDCGSTSRAFEVGIATTLRLVASVSLQISREIYEHHRGWIVAYLLLTVAAAVVSGLLFTGWASVIVTLILAVPLFYVGLRAVIRVRSIT